MHFRLLFILTLFLECFALQITRFHVPSHLIAGTQTQFLCEFLLKRDEKLYSLRWYANDTEFFRYEPKAEAKVQIFPMAQLTLDMRRPTNGSYLRVQRITPNASAIYKCELLLDKTFLLVQKEQYMQVQATSSAYSITSGFTLLIITYHFWLRAKYK